jgi:hypothetical protein
MKAVFQKTTIDELVQAEIPSIFKPLHPGDNIDNELDELVVLKLLLEEVELVDVLLPLLPVEVDGSFNGDETTSIIVPDDEDDWFVAGLVSLKPARRKVIETLLLVKL